MRVHPLAGLADALRQDLGALEALAPHLDDCLEMRRIACPRLYRLSDADLLGLLARCAEDPLGAVQQHVGKMFPGIAHLELAGESGKAEEIRAIVSPEGEHVALARAAKACTLAPFILPCHAHRAVNGHRSEAGGFTGS